MIQGNWFTFRLKTTNPANITTPKIRLVTSTFFLYFGSLIKKAVTKTVRHLLLLMRFCSRKFIPSIDLNEEYTLPKANIPESLNFRPLGDSNYLHHIVIEVVVLFVLPTQEDV